jgi:hypothetical protein
MKCSKCQYNGCIWGYNDDTPEDHELNKHCVAACKLCGQLFLESELPSNEKQLEVEVIDLWGTIDKLKDRDNFEQLYPWIADKVNTLHDRIITELGSVHWTAAEMMWLHYEYDDVLTRTFNCVHFAEAHIKWLKSVLPQVPSLWALKEFQVGVGQCMSPQKTFQMNGRRYWQDCYVEYKVIWGEDDEDVKAMQTLLENFVLNKIRADIAVCSFTKCSTPLEDRPKEYPLLCSRCYLANYCSPKCQKNDWKLHKLMCEKCKDIKSFQELVPEFVKPDHF